MYCSRCGAQNSDNVTNCCFCGAPLTLQNSNNEDRSNLYHGNLNYNYYPQNNKNQANISNHLAFSIIVLVFSALDCCTYNIISIVLSIIAVVFAAQVDSKLRYGDNIGAEKCSKTALVLTWISLGIIIAFVLLIILAVIFAVSLPYML